MDTVRIALPGVKLCGPRRGAWERFTEHRGPLRGTSERLIIDDAWPAWAHGLRLFVSFRGELALECSLAHVANGDNVLAGDPSLAVARLDYLIRWAFPKHTLPSVKEWHTRRADVFFNFRPKCAPFEIALEAVLALRSARRTHRRLIGDTTLYFSSSAKRPGIEICLYDKYAEAKANGRPHAPEAVGTIRVEVRMLYAAVVARAVGASRHAQLGEILGRRCLGDAMLRHLRLLDIEPGLISVSNVRDELKQRLGAAASRRLTPYVELRAAGGRERVCFKLGISQEVGRRYERELRKAGIYAAAVRVDGIVEDLVNQIERGAGLQPAGDHVVPSGKEAAP